MIVSSDNGVSVDVTEIAILGWNPGRTECWFWLKGNNQRFSHFEPKSDDKIDTGEVESAYDKIAGRNVAGPVLRSSLEILRARFP